MKTKSTACLSSPHLFPSLTPLSRPPCLPAYFHFHMHLGVFKHADVLTPIRFENACPDHSRNDHVSVCTRVHNHTNHTCSLPLSCHPAPCACSARDHRENEGDRGKNAQSTSAQNVETHHPDHHAPNTILIDNIDVQSRLHPAFCCRNSDNRGPDDDEFAASKSALNLSESLGSLLYFTIMKASSGRECLKLDIKVE